MNITVSDSWLGKKRGRGVLINVIVIRICDGKTLSLLMNRKISQKKKNRTRSLSSNDHLLFHPPYLSRFSILPKLFTIIYFSSEGFSFVGVTKISVSRI